MSKYQCFYKLKKDSIDDIIYISYKIKISTKESFFRISICINIIACIRKKTSNMTKLTLIEKETNNKKEAVKFSNMVVNLAEQGKIKFSDSKLDYIQDCSSWNRYLSDEQKEKHKLYMSNSCKDRFCPVCSKRKSRKDILKTLAIVNYLHDEFNYSFIFLTLTVPNVKSSELSNSIEHIRDSFKRFYQSKEFFKINKGYMRKLEVTYNKKRDDYHPHLHVLIAVNRSYFTSRDYLSHKRILDLWRRSTRDPSITQVNIQRIYSKGQSLSNSLKALNGAVLEIGKYMNKTSDYLHSEEVLLTFITNLKGKRYYDYSGVFRDANKLLEQGKLERFKLADETEYVYLLEAVWNGLDYEKEYQRIEDLPAGLREDINEFMKNSTTIEDKCIED